MDLDQTLTSIKKSFCGILQNLWTILIRPLFEQLTVLYYSERGATNREQVNIALRDTFRKFTLLKKIKNEVLHDLMQFDINERAALNMVVTKRKWKRKELYEKEQNSSQRAQRITEFVSSKMPNMRKGCKVLYRTYGDTPPDSHPNL